MGPLEDENALSGESRQEGSGENEKRYAGVRWTHLRE